MKKGTVFLTGVAALALAAAGCFSPYTGGNDAAGANGSITIALGGTSRAMVNPDTELSRLRHEITLRGPDGASIVRTVTGGASLTVEAAPGDWTVKVRARGPQPDYYDDFPGDDDFPEDAEGHILRALGEASVTVEAGAAAAAEVTMISATEVSSWAQLQTAVSAANRVEVNGELAPTAREEIIVLYQDMVFPYDENEINSIVLGTGEGKNITLMADKDVTITRESQDSQTLFTHNDGTLTLGRPGMTGTITFHGGYNPDDPLLSNRTPLISCEGGDGIAPFLVMNDGVTLTNNCYYDNSGGAVNVSSGNFMMNGGTISNNIVSGIGGAVHVVGGSFTMNGGTIDHNTASVGGGVGVRSGSFTMNGGTIGNNLAYDAIGGGVLIETGKFDMTGGIIRGNRAQATTFSGGKGGGVHIANFGVPPAVDLDVRLLKTGGIIYGNEADDPNNVNIVEDNAPNQGMGAAVYYEYGLPETPETPEVYYRETTLNETDSLSTDDLAAGWLPAQ